MFADDFTPQKNRQVYGIRDFEAGVADRLLKLSGSFFLTHQGAIDHRVQGCAAPDCCIKGEQTHPGYQTLRSITSLVRFLVPCIQGPAFTDFPHSLMLVLFLVSPKVEA